jgi:hypothetical protein
MIENGFVRIPETAPWLAEYLHELTVFPNGKHDDQVDSTAQFLDWFKRPFPNQGICQYYRQLALEAVQRRKPQLAPPNPPTGDRVTSCSQIQSRTGPRSAKRKTMRRPLRTLSSGAPSRPSTMV